MDVKSQHSIYLTVEQEILLSKIKNRLLKKGLRFTNSDVVVEALMYYWKNAE